MAVVQNLYAKYWVHGVSKASRNVNVSQEGNVSNVSITRLGVI